MVKGFFEEFNYLQWIDFDREMHSNCTCKDFVFRHLKRQEKEGEHPKIIQVGECKHIKAIREKLKNGNNS